ncbi:hypothetical protein MMC19_000972 [Ptychographa xylographoides]|nr:hypothetical protein [Ptychographa xylographoides]
MNGMGGGMIDGSGTINPAALNTPGSVLPTPASINAPITSPRGIKRSRSPDTYGQLPLGAPDDDGKSFPPSPADAFNRVHRDPRTRWAREWPRAAARLTSASHRTDDSKPRKRGRPPKRTSGGGIADSPPGQTPQQTHQSLPAQLQTPQIQTQGLPSQSHVTPTQTSPPKATPTKQVVKALPTVRDHTTDQLSPEGDEYIPREYDEAGERKVSTFGRALEGREYKCRTFLVPNRGDKLFMLATECARVLGYRDSYLLFNKNRSLYKIIATQPEKDDLIHQDILPYSYRSRQIAIVTAKSMFRQFGSRVILNGRRVRDDYWEAKAKKQGFTEEDMAGEKRPGGAKAAREAQAAEAATAAALGNHQDIVYSTGPGTIPVDAHGHPQLMQSGMGGALAATLAPLPMIHLAPSEDMRLRDYGNIPRPRQEITGTPYQDRTQPSSTTEIMNQAANNAEFSKVLNQQRGQRAKYLEDDWRQKRGNPAASPMQHATETGPAISQSLQSPQLASSSMMGPTHQSMLQQQQGSQIMNPSAFSQQPHPQPHQAQSPSRVAHQQMRPDQVQHRPSNLSYSSTSVPQGSPYSSYPQPSQMWGQPPPQPQQSPATTHHASMPQYPQPQPHHSSHSPHLSQSPQQHTPHPQLQHAQSSGSMHGAGMGYQGMPMAQPGYPAMGVNQRSMYQQQSQSPQAYMHGQTTAGSTAGLQGWAPPPQAQSQSHAGQQQGWSGY